MGKVKTNSLNNLPYVIESDNDRDKSYDIYSRLLEDRIIFISSEIDQELASSITAQLLFLDRRDPDKDISLYINCQGGCIFSGLAIYDTMNLIKAPVKTFCIGLAASMASVLLAGGKRGYRYALPNSNIMIHQPRTANRDWQTVTEQEADFNLNKRLKDSLNQILSKNTGKSLEEVTKDCEGDKWLNAEEAVAYGLIDKVITKNV